MNDDIKIVNKDGQSHEFNKQVQILIASLACSHITRNVQLFCHCPVTVQTFFSEIIIKLKRKHFSSTTEMKENDIFEEFFVSVYLISVFVQQRNSVTPVPNYMMHMWTSVKYKYIV